MSDRARDLLTHGVAAAKADEREEAESYLERVLYTDATQAQKIRAWEWLAQLEDNPRKKRDYLEEIILREPGNAVARRGLALLNGDLNVADLIDPTHRPKATPAQADAPSIQDVNHGPNQPSGEGTQAKRLVCPSCAGPMAYTAGNRGLRCEYCDQELTLLQALEAGAVVEEQDFAVALATAKGHTNPVSMQAFSCQGCGVPFVLGPAVLSVSCPYCESAHIIEQRQTIDLLPPRGIIPFQLNLAQVQPTLTAWFKKHHLLNQCQVHQSLGMYVPVWTFDIGGAITGTVRGYNRGARGVRMPAQTVERPIFYDDIPVIATRRLPKKLAQEIDNFDLKQVLPFDPGYLADWPADTYQIPAAEASLAARKRAWDDAREIVGAQMRDQVAGPFGDSNVEMTFSSAKMIVDAFKLIFVPLWMIHYHYQGQTYAVVVNGQNGHVRGQKPPGGFRRWLKGLWG